MKLINFGKNILERRGTYRVLSYSCRIFYIKRNIYLLFIFLSQNLVNHTVYFVFRSKFFPCYSMHGRCHCCKLWRVSSEYSLNFIRGHWYKWVLLHLRLNSRSCTVSISANLSSIHLQSLVRGNPSDGARSRFTLREASIQVTRSANSLIILNKVISTCVACVCRITGIVYRWVIVRTLILLIKTMLCRWRWVEGAIWGLLLIRSQLWLEEDWSIILHLYNDLETRDDYIY